MDTLAINADQPAATSLAHSSADCGCGITRRDLLLAAGSLALLASPRRAMAGPFTAADFRRMVPEEKKLRPEWVKALFDRGAPEVYRGADLEKIGMPVSGLCSGQLYLGGDGKLWRWDLFNSLWDGNSSGPHYANPLKPESPVDQGFAIRITGGAEPQTRLLDRSGFVEIAFRGGYPIGRVEYRDPACPLAVSLEAFSPFIPLSVDDSSLPATVMRFTVHNTSPNVVSATLAGWMENAICLNNRWQAATRRNRILRERGLTLLDGSVEKLAPPAAPLRPEVVFEDWNKERYDGWTVEGTAFGTGPLKRSQIIPYQGDVGGEGERVVNSHAAAPGKDVVARDAATGRLTSRPFTINRNFLQFWIGGGAHKGKTCLNLVVDGKAVRSATGKDDNRMSLQNWDLRELRGKEARIEIVDADTGPWGNIGVGKITLSDVPAAGTALEQLPDYGTMSLALLGAPAEHARASAESGGFDGPGGEEAAAPLADRLTGAVGRRMRLRPGQSREVTFVIAWRFPNLELHGLGKVGRHYAARFDSSAAVARYVAANFSQLVSQTRRWRDTWYDSTLPYWFLDRTFANASIPATSTCYRLADGRFYAWEGVSCCPGTCTHVWHYAQALARLFPELERLTRERVDLGVAFNPGTGVMGFRAEFDRNLAVDGQAGTLLRIYREHQMSGDDAFLKRNWPHIRKAFEPLLRLDADEDGVLEGAQMNTLDQPWFGKISWLSSLYVAALRAGEAMAREVGETEFAQHCRDIASRGTRNIDAQLFNGEYYLQRPDPAHPKTVGCYNGCEIDQVFGDSWLRQVGLSPILPQTHVKSALASLWRYNFTPDVGPFRAAHKQGRWYAMPGEAGLLMCSWPQGEQMRVETGFDYYFNECMTGFEHQVAGHMIGEGMLTEGLAIERAIHDRYHPSRRNPWNEVECSDHYARAMASYGVFLAACGYEHHGPKGHLGFAPKLSPENFKAAFTAAEGWGSFSQQVTKGELRAEVAVRWGRLRLKTLALELPPGMDAERVRVTLGRRGIAATRAVEGRRLMVTLAHDESIPAGQTLVARIG